MPAWRVSLFRISVGLSSGAVGGFSLPFPFPLLPSLSPAPLLIVKVWTLHLRYSIPGVRSRSISPPFKEVVTLFLVRKKHLKLKEVGSVKRR